jgi:DNA-binding LytR/AlgR family response regulator
LTFRDRYGNLILISEKRESFLYMGIYMQLIVGICDDCEEQVDLLNWYLNNYRGEDELVSVSATNPLRFLELAREKHPDIVFLDIDMKTLNGIQLGERIKAELAETIIVYVTAHEKYALEAFRVRAFHYLLKPLTQEKVETVLAEAVAFIRRNRETEQKRVFTMQRRGEMASLPMTDIICFEKVGHKIRVHTVQQCEEYYGNFTELMPQIGHKDFIQCHQGYIVSVAKIRAFRDRTLFLDGGLQAPVSRTFAENVRGALAKRLFAGKDGA